MVSSCGKRVTWGGSRGSRRGGEGRGGRRNDWKLGVKKKYAMRCTIEKPEEGCPKPGSVMYILSISRTMALTRIKTKVVGVVGFRYGEVCFLGARFLSLLVRETEGMDEHVKKQFLLSLGKDNLISMLCGMYIDAPPPQTSSHSLMNVGGKFNPNEHDKKSFFCVIWQKLDFSIYPTYRCSLPPLPHFPRIFSRRSSTYKA